MDNTYSRKRKRSNDSLSDYQIDNKRLRIDDKNNIDNENEIKEIIDNAKRNISNRLINHSLNKIFLSDEIYSEFYKSRQKMNFMHGIWQLLIPQSKINTDFVKTEVIMVHDNFPCTFLLDFNYFKKEFSFAIQIGEGDDIKKNFELEKSREIIRIDHSNKMEKFKDNHNVEEININDVCWEGKEINQYTKSSKGASPTITYISTSPIYPEPGSSDENIKFNNYKESLTKELEEDRLELDLKKKHTTFPINYDEQNKLSNINSKRKINQECEKSFQEIGPCGSNQTIFNIMNSNVNSIKLQENVKNTENNRNEEFFNVSINFVFGQITYENVNISFLNLQPGQVGMEKIKISDEIYAELLNFNNNMRIPLVIEININKNFPAITKYVGIINEGTTCYMNSMLQSLNFLGYFKNAVFQIPISVKEGLSRSVTYSLQKIFYDLMTESKAISAIQLIKSFGWTREEMLMQHDVQEFNLNLSELMEDKMKGTIVEGTFKYLFEGKIMNYIQCLNVDYKSIKEENFLDLQLTVKYCNNIYESFDKYTEEEILENENKYDAEKFGAQVAKKGVKFLELPKVLILQLKRFEYNFQRDTLEKVNDYFEFYNEIDLSKYVTHREGASIGLHTYSLHSVLVHTGFPNTGHYYAYIKPETNSRWVKFNDEDVKYADDYEVFENNFGGNQIVYKNLPNGEIIKQEFKSDSNAYILIYIQNSTKQTILSNVSETDIPQELRNLFKKEKLNEKRQIFVDIISKNNMVIQLFSKEILKNQSSLGLTPALNFVDEGLLYTDIKNRISITLPKEMKIIQFIEYLSSKTNIPSNMIKLYKYALQYSTVLLKRFCYATNQIDETLYNYRLKDLYTIIAPKKYHFMIYVHIDDNQDNLFSFLEEGNFDNSVSNIKNNFDLENSEEIILQMDNLFTDNINSHFIETPEEEYGSVSIQDDEYPYKKTNQIIHFSKRENFWKFKKNINKSSKIQLNGFNLIASPNVTNENEILKQDHKIVCVIKYLKIKLTENNNFETKLQVGDIVSVENFHSLGQLYNIINFKERYKSYLDENFISAINKYDESQINLSIEQSSFKDLQLNKGFNVVFNCRDIVPLEHLKNSIICVIVNIKWNEKIKFFNKEIDSLQDLIRECCNNLLNTASIRFNYLVNRKMDIYRNYNHGQKIKLRLNLSESELKESILNDLKCEIKGKNLIKEIFSLENPFDKASTMEYYIYDSNSDLLFIDEFINKYQSDIIEFLPFNETERENIQFYKDYPAIKFIHRKSGEFVAIFKINFITPSTKEAMFFYSFDFNIFDIHNTFISRLTVCLPKNILKIYEILEFFSNHKIISKFYKNFDETLSSKNISNNQIDKEENKYNSPVDNKIINNEDKIGLNNFYFILQHPETMIAYDLITDRGENLREYESRSNYISYRLQPYPHDEVSLIPLYNKLFYSVVDTEYNPLYHPLVIFLNVKTTKVITMKNLIIKKLKKIECIRNVYKDDLSSKNCLSRIKFYTSILDNFRPKPLTFLNLEKDENLLNEILEKGPPNFIVKLPSKGTSNFFPNQEEF